MKPISSFFRAAIALLLSMCLTLSTFVFPVSAANGTTNSAEPSVVSVEDSAILSQPQILETVSKEGFVHPSIGFSADTLHLMQQKVAIGAEPWASAFESFRQKSSGSLDYDIRNQSKVDPSKPAYTKVNNDARAKEAKVDAEAAFTDAVIWTATGDIRYRQKAMQIIRLWSQIDPTNPTGFTDSHISIGDAMANMVRAAELLRYTECEGEWGWTEADTSGFVNNFLMAFYDGNFYHNNGRWMNQHGIVTLAYTMAAVFSNNQTWYKEAVEWATVNKAAPQPGLSGDIFHQIRYVTKNERTGAPVNPHVQLVEMGRDMGHASGNTSTLSQIAYMTEIQGTKVDPDASSATFGEISRGANGVGLFEFLDNRILAGANILAQYNLGYNISYTPVNVSNGAIADPSASYYDTVSDNGRGLGYASELTYGYYTHLAASPLDPTDDRISYLHESIEKQGGLQAIPGYVLLQGTEDLSTGEVKGPPQPLSQLTYAETRKAYDRFQAFDFLGRSATTSTNIYQDQDGMRSVLYDVRYANQYTWYDLNLADSYDRITIRAASNSSAGTKVDVILLDNVPGIDRTNVTADNLAAGEVMATLQVPNTGWWTNYATVTGQLNRPLSGEHLLAFKYYGSTNALSYQIAFDWFAFSDYYAGDTNLAADGIRSGSTETVSDGVQLSKGGSISYAKMNFDSGINDIELNARTTDGNGKLLLYSDGELVTTYSLKNTSGAMLTFTSTISAVDMARITGIHDIELRYEGASPIVLKSYRNVERNRLIESETSSSVMQIEDQAIAIAGAFEIDSQEQRSYVNAANGSLIYMSQGALQVDRTKDAIVTFTVQSNGPALLNLHRDQQTTPFAVIHVPDTQGQWMHVSTNISQQYVNPNDYPTNLKSFFLSMTSDNPNTLLRLDSYELDPSQKPPVIKVTTERGDALGTAVAYENGNDFTLHVAIEDTDSSVVLLSTDSPGFMTSALNGKNGGTVTIHTAGLAAGEYAFRLYARDDTDNYVEKEVKLLVYPERDNHAPINLSGALTGPNSIALQWPSVNGASYYGIYRKQGTSGEFRKIAEIAQTSYSDTGLSEGVTYSYRVTAGGNTGETLPSAIAHVRTLSAISVTPSMVTASTSVYPGTSGTPAENGWLAFDENTVTSTDTTNKDGWILIDLGAGNEKAIGGIKFYPRASNFWKRMNDGSIQGSNDGTHFVNLYTFSGIGSAQWFFVTFNNDTAYRYIRYYTPAGYANVAELKFYANTKDTEELAVLLQQAAAIDAALYTEDSLIQLQTAAANAQAVYDNAAAANQADINGASLALRNALEALQPKEVVAVLEPAEPTGSNGWYVTPVIVTLSPSAGVEFSLDGGTSWSAYASPVTLAQEGTNVLLYRSTMRPNETRKIAAKIDLTAPKVTINGADSYTIDQTVLQTCSVYDEGSGAASSTACSEPLLQVPAYTLQPGINSVSITVEDAAGHPAVVENSYSVVVTVASLKAVTSQLLEEKNANGWSQVAQSLNQTLDRAGALIADGKNQQARAVMNGYLNEVRSKTGQWLTADQASILIRWGGILTDGLPLAEGAPGQAVLSDDNGHDTGLRDGSYIVTMNMWWGSNGTTYKLYENGNLIDTKTLADHSPAAQTASTPIVGKSNGVYVYTCELINQYGTTSCGSHKVTVTDALPGKPVLSSNNWDGDGNYTIAMNMWWGTNGTVFRLYENGVLVESIPITEATPQAQAASIDISGRSPGAYKYVGVLENASGSTKSEELIVKVTTG